MRTSLPATFQPRQQLYQHSLILSTSTAAARNLQVQVELGFGARRGRLEGAPTYSATWIIRFFQLSLCSQYHHAQDLSLLLLLSQPNDFGSALERYGRSERHGQGIPQLDYWGCGAQYKTLEGHYCRAKEKEGCSIFLLKEKGKIRKRVVTGRS